MQRFFLFKMLFIPHLLLVSLLHFPSYDKKKPTKLQLTEKTQKFNRSLSNHARRKCTKMNNRMTAKYLIK